MASVEPVLKHLDADFDNAVGRWAELLRFKSIGTDPAYDADTRGAAQWIVNQLSALGFDVGLRETPGNPMIVAHYPGPEGYTGPHLMYYGHYDVQPADPVELWDTDPFEPTVVDGPHGKRMVCRGAVDDKGQVMTWLEAFRGWHAVHGALPARITVLIEGEEESGSPSFVPFLQANKDELKADVCVVSDTGSWDIDTPAISYMLRGLVYLDLRLHGPNRDLHSGQYGGAVPNPINVLTRVLGQLHDENGRIQIPGFYDDVIEPSDAEKKQWESLAFDEGRFLRDIGLTTPAGEKGRSIMERRWSRPTCDLNGIFGGYMGEGSKTVIASWAGAKLSCRLVPGQDPHKVLDGIKRFLNERTPPDCRWEIETHGVSAAIRVRTDSPYLKAALAGLKDIYGREPVLMGMGGSIPAVGYMQSILGFDSLLVGFGLEDDKVHSPNEKFEFKCFRNGMRSHAAMLAKLAAVSG